MFCAQLFPPYNLFDYEWWKKKVVSVKAIVHQSHGYTYHQIVTKIRGKYTSRRMKQTTKKWHVFG